MIKKILSTTLFKNAGIYTITNVINAAIPFFLLPILTRHLDPEEYGIVSMFTLLITFTIPFVGLSVNGAIARQYYNQDKFEIRTYVGNSIFILLLSTGLVSIFFFLFAKKISQLTSFPADMFWTIVVYAVSQFLIEVLLTLWQVQKKSIPYGLFSISKTTLNIILSIILVVVFDVGWKGRIYGQVIAVLIYALLALCLLLKYRLVKFEMKKAYVKNALLFGVPLIPHALSGSIISMTDRLFITNMVGLAVTGVYTVGYQIGSIINILSGSFNKAYVPWLYEKLNDNNQSANRKIVKFTYVYFLLIIMLALLLGLMAPYVLDIILGTQFNESSIYVIWVALGYAFNGMYLMVVNYIFYAQKTKFLAAVTFFTAITNIVLNYLFIKIFGAIGAAQATTITYFLKFIIVWYLSGKAQKMPWNLFKKPV